MTNPTPTPALADEREAQMQDSSHLADNEASAKSLQPLLDALHGQIMNLPCKVPDGYAPGKADELVYRFGHRDARHAAAELVAAFASSGPSEKEVGAAPLPVQGQDEQAKNAARYEWLRTYAPLTCLDAFEIEGGANPDEELDKAIDAALRASSAPTTKGTI